MLLSLHFSLFTIMLLASITMAAFLVPLIFSWQLAMPSNQSILPISIAIDSNAYLLSLVASISISVHMVVDLLGHGILSGRSNIFCYRDSLSNLIILVSLLIPDFVQIFYVIPYNDPLIFHLIHRIRNAMIIFATLGYLSIVGGNIWRTTRVILAMTLANLGFILKFYGFFAIHGEYLLLSIFSMICFAVATFILVLCTSTWSKYIVNIHRSGQRLTTNENCCNVYLISFWVAITWLWSLCLGRNFGNWYDYKTSTAIQQNVLFSAYYILIVVFQRHIAIREAVTYSVSLIIRTVYIIAILTTILYCTLERNQFQKKICTLHFT